MDFLFFATPGAMEKLAACAANRSVSASDVAAYAAIVFSLATAIGLYVLQRRDARIRDIQQDTQTRISSALELHREYNTRAFANVRSEARKFVRQNRDRGEAWIDAPSFSTWDDPKDEKAAKAASLHEVMRFFHQWGALAKTGRIDGNVAFELLGQDLAWWYGFAFEAMRDRRGSRTLPSIRFLVESMQTRPTAQSWQNWVNEGFQERQETR
ncbi:hypothetical protein SAMN05216228_1008113 [Rhizobium tibeticum]|uniref:Uncharacterized protein n=1 Tax=Rhizobium tibeticum TaxID=501024 RepID=A0A1H8K0B3_9HYPH|nr:hypothetical protein RTCCBAU85039_2345 [Rhizobium tibeticum]SEN85868.1 hypothetical protein SAMN05216228_1008113 [Rhizobium tibeticum]